jgi:hypothetical protein
MSYSATDSTGTGLSHCSCSARYVLSAAIDGDADGASQVDDLVMQLAERARSQRLKHQLQRGRQEPVLPRELFPQLNKPPGTQRGPEPPALAVPPSPTYREGRPL